ncbi:Clan CA, family C54, ATG4-like cysteine peptidase [Histomonas meleagridis]|uniref:Clan CA, family C54, ATG4-like cysteine peptidase n=1 Tax=Histomonas meleagridis TaxID=135588 RepID=UPI003559D07D|nr:Clan CA, family C54, ATG4-like cysteine peptidase [Histomonas meleagridis]KAH0802499.1 Clan CA, family C54, ATG4-like cysteine peptidase [Histomonas meleagridis]
MLVNYLQSILEQKPEVFEQKFGHSNPLALFNDNYQAPFSIHNICKEIINIGGHEGERATVTQLAFAIQNLLDPYKLPVYVCRNSTLVIDEIVQMIEGNHFVLCLAPLLCGYKKFDTKCFDFIAFSLGLKNGLGFIGGVKRKSFYYVGFSSTHFFYFDPHTTKKKVTNENQYKTYYEPELKSIKIENISSSLMIAFYFTDIDQFMETIQVMRQLPFLPLSIMEHFDQSLLHDEINIDDNSFAEESIETDESSSASCAFGDPDDFEIISKEELLSELSNGHP